MWTLSGCFILCMFICLPLYLHYKPRSLHLAVSFKALGTLCAFVPALVASLKLDPCYWFFAAALILHAAGDVLLECFFSLGMRAFLLGHVCYFLAFWKMFPVQLSCFILFLCFIGYLAYLFYKNRNKIGKSILPFAVYGAILSLTAAGGIAGGSSAYSWKGWMIVLGSALFFFSDYLIFRNLLYPSHSRNSKLIMITYYLAQLLLGGSCLF